MNHPRMNLARRALLLGGLCAAAAASSACGALGVKPWERDLMARPEMALEAYPIDSGIDEHIYFSKEAATGGGGFGGGGCGCN